VSSARDKVIVLDVKLTRDREIALTRQALWNVYECWPEAPQEQRLAFLTELLDIKLREKLLDLVPEFQQLLDEEF
jgi:hypothetical protein